MLKPAPNSGKSDPPGTEEMHRQIEGHHLLRCVNCMLAINCIHKPTPSLALKVKNLGNSLC